MDEVTYDRLCDFRNHLRILSSIDFQELVPAVFDEGDIAGWLVFRDNPWRWMILAENDHAEAVWEVIEQRAYEARVARLPKPPAPNADDEIPF